MSTPVTLTADQIAVIRLDIGDGCDVLTDEQLQIAYNAASGDACGTNAILSRWIWMRAKTSVINLAQGSYVSSKAVDILRERMDYWEICAGTGPGTLRAGVISLHTDTTWADMEADLLSEWGWLP